MIRRRVHRNPLLVVALFLLTAGSFFLPFLTVEQERVATATGVELMSGDARFSGRYVHAAYEGEVERMVERGRAPATIAFAAAVVGILISWSAHGVARMASLVAAAVGLLAAAAMLQVTSSPFNEVDRHVGTWLSLLLFLATVVVAGVRAATSPPRRDAPAEANVPPWLRG